MPLTLKQVVTRLETLALAHRQINHFYFGAPIEWLSNGEVRYPALFVDVVTGNIDKAKKETTWNFQIMLCDLCNVSSKARESELELMSDLTLIAEDYKSMLEFNEYRDWTIGETSPIEYRKEELEDIVIGVKIDLAIGTDYLSDRCRVPADDVSFETDSAMQIINNYIYTGQGTEGNSITIGTLAGKTILMLFKGDKLLTPTSEEEIEVNEYKLTGGSGTFEFGTDIEEGQVIQILNK